MGGIHGREIAPWQFLRRKKFLVFRGASLFHTHGPGIRSVAKFSELKRNERVRLSKFLYGVCFYLRSQFHGANHYARLARFAGPRGRSCGWMSSLMQNSCRELSPV